MARTVGSTAAQTRQRVLQAALELFAERSYAGTSLRDIAERTDITKAALYYHFPAKDALLRALIQPLLDELDACVREAGQTPTRLLIRRVVDVFDDHRHILRGTLYDPSARQVLIEQHSMFDGLTRLERILARSAKPADLLRAQCAIGAIRGAIISVSDIDFIALNKPPDQDADPFGPRLSDADRDTVVDAAMGALGEG